MNQNEEMEPPVSDNTEGDPTAPIQAGEEAGSAGNALTDRFVRALQIEGDASLSDALAGCVTAGRDVHLTDALGGAVVAGAAIDLSDSAGGIIVAGGNTSLQDSPVGLLFSRQATVENSTIGVLLTPQVALGDNVKVIASTRQAIAFGTAFGLVAGLVGLLFRRRR